MARPNPTRTNLPKAVVRKMDRTVVAYVEHLDLIQGFLKQVFAALQDSLALNGQIHSIKTRVKDQEHLRRKLERRYRDAKNKREYNITPENLFETVNDLAGARLLHLHTRQFEGIHKALCEIFKRYGFPVLEGPVAKTWDDESRKYFEGIGVVAEPSITMYTSVHYVIGSGSGVKLTCEIQVRTLAEELWGEVSHDINYPILTDNVSCEEQIKTLARATSTATRLVDSIYRTRAWHEEHFSQVSARPRKRRH